MTQYICTYTFNNWNKFYKLLSKTHAMHTDTYLF